MAEMRTNDKGKEWRSTTFCKYGFLLEVLYTHPQTHMHGTHTHTYTDKYTCTDPRWYAQPETRYSAHALLHNTSNLLFTHFINI